MMAKQDWRQGSRVLMLGVAAALALAFALSVPGVSAARAADDADARLDRLIEGALREGGPFFTAEERAVIERQCGYAPGSWDGFEANMIDDVFYCRNGRRLDDPEVRAIMRAAEPRIERRVETVMARADVSAAIAEVAREAEQEALRELAERSED